MNNDTCSIEQLNVFLEKVEGSNSILRSVRMDVDSSLPKPPDLDIQSETETIEDDVSSRNTTIEDEIENETPGEPQNVLAPMTESSQTCEKTLAEDSRRDLLNSNKLGCIDYEMGCESEKLLPSAKDRSKDDIVSDTAHGMEESAQLVSCEIIKPQPKQNVDCLGRDELKKVLEVAKNVGKTAVNNKLVGSSLPIVISETALAPKNLQENQFSKYNSKPVQNSIFMNGDCHDVETAEDNTKLGKNNGKLCVEDGVKKLYDAGTKALDDEDVNKSVDSVASEVEDVQNIIESIICKVVEHSQCLVSDTVDSSDNSLPCLSHCYSIAGEHIDNNLIALNNAVPTEVSINPLDRHFILANIKKEKDEGMEVEDHFDVTKIKQECPDEYSSDYYSSLAEMKSAGLKLVSDGVDIKGCFVNVHKLAACDVETVSCKTCIQLPRIVKVELDMEEEERTVQCDVCAKVFSCLAVLNKHMSIKHAVLSNVCSICQGQFSSPEVLQAHMELHAATAGLGGPPYVCPLCQSPFPSRKSLAIHSRIHKKRSLPPPPVVTHQCKICQKEFNSAASLHSHIGHHKKARKKQSTHKCSVCKAQFLTELALKTHEAKHARSSHTKAAKFLCKVCNKGFYTPASLNSHIGHHKKVTSQVQGHYCTACNTKFLTVQGLQSHLAWHTRSIKKTLTETQQASAKKKIKLSIKIKEEVTEVQPQQTSSSEHKCPHCRRVFSSAVGLSAHAVQHQSEYSCTRCKRRYSSYSSLAKHRRAYHYKRYEPTRRLRRFRCDVCLRTFCKQSALTEHKKMHRGEEADSKERVVSTSADVDNSTTRRYKLPFRWLPHEKFDGKQFMCKLCNKTFKLRRSLYHHRNSHLEEHMTEPVQGKLLEHESCSDGRYMCNLCRRSFPDQSNLRLHRPHHYDEILQSLYRPEHKCTECDVTCPNTLELQKHMLLVHSVLPKVACKHCDQMFYRKKHLKRHMTEVHKGYLHTCKVCSKMFMSKKNCASHMKSHPPEVKTPALPPGLFKCEVCSRVLRSRSSLDSHMGQHASGKTHACRFCVMLFHDEVSLEEHEEKHSQGRYRCQVCKRRFKANSKLKIHMAVHTGYKPYQCPFCNRCFALASQLKSHMTVDHGLILPAGQN